MRNALFGNRFQFEIDLNNTVIYLMVIVYGVYGATTPNAQDLINLELEALFFFMFPIFTIGVLISIGLPRKTEKIGLVVSLRIFDLVLFCLLYACLLSISFDELDTSLVGDEIYYAQTGFLHASLILERLLNDFSFLKSALEKHSLILINFFGILGFLFFILALDKLLSRKHQLLVLVGFLLLTRTIVALFGGNEITHPPLSSLAPMFAGTLFGISDLVFKLSYFSVYVVFVFYLYKRISKNADKYSAGLISISIATLPVLWALASSVEQALWSLICFCVVCLELLLEEKVNHKKLALIVTVFCFFRITSALAFVPLVTHYIICNRSFNLKNTFEKLGLSVPVLALAPFFLFVLHNGTPSFSLDSNAASDYSILLSGGFVKHFVNTYQIHLIFISMLIFFLPVGFKRKGSLSVFALVILLVYYGISEDLLGQPKYLAELAVVFILCGLVGMTNLFTKGFFITRSCLVIVISLNVLFITNFPNNCQQKGRVQNSSELLFPVLDKSGCNIKLYHPYDFGKAYRFVSDLGVQANLYAPGVTYGVFPMVMNSFTSDSIRFNRTIYNEQKDYNALNGISWTSADANSIDSNEDIQTVILGFMTEKDRLVEDLKQLGWSISFVSVNETYRSKVHVLQRN